MDTALLRIETLGTFRLLRLTTGSNCYEEITINLSRTGPPLTFLKVLLAIEPQLNNQKFSRHQASKDCVIDALWPEEDTVPTDSNNALAHAKSTVNRALRPFLGGQDLILRTEGSDKTGYQLNLALVAIDADEFDQLCIQASEAEGRNDEDGALHYWESAWALVQGDFLPQDQYNDWSKTRRERLASGYRLCLHRLAFLLCKSNRTIEAIETLHAYAHTYPSHVDVLLVLIPLLSHQRRYEEILHLINACKEAYKCEEREVEKELIDIESHIRQSQKAAFGDLAQSIFPMHKSDKHHQHLRQEPNLERQTPSSRIPHAMRNVRIGQGQYPREQDSIETAGLTSSFSSPLRAQQTVLSSLSSNGAQSFIGKKDCLSIKLGDSWEQSSLVFPNPLNADKEFLANPFLGLQQKLSQEVITLNTSHKNDSQCSLSRREAILAIAILAMPMLVPPQKRFTSLDIEEILSSLAKSIHACWQLSNEFDIVAIHSVISTYIPPLVSIVKQSPFHRKEAAHLAAQSFLLNAIIGRHVANLQAAEASCKEAVIYSEIAEDPVLQIATLRHLAMIYYYTKCHKKELALYQQITPFLSHEGIPPIVQSFVYAGKAGTQAVSGLQYEAQTSLALAREMFFLQPVAEVCPLYIDYDYSQLFISEGLTYYDLGCYKEALDSFLHVDGLSPKIPVAERGRLEFLNCQALTMLRLPHRDREMQLCIKYWIAGIQGAIILKSRQRYDEACHIYELMTFVWPHDKKIKDLRELIAQ